MDNREQQPAENKERNNIEQNQNTSLQDPGASVADYGKADQNFEELQEKHGRESGKGNSSIPMDEEDTLGIP
jgi:hypothetical protein